MCMEEGDEGVDTNSSAERLKEVNMFSLEMRQLRGDMIIFFKYLKGCYIEHCVELFFVAPDGWHCIILASQMLNSPPL